MAIDKTLRPHEKLSRNKKPVLVCILDGWGENVAKDKYNAIHSADTPVTGDTCLHLTSVESYSAAHYRRDFSTRAMSLACSSATCECTETFQGCRVMC